MVEGVIEQDGSGGSGGRCGGSSAAGGWHRRILEILNEGSWSVGVLE
jgi:hypothetical protein